MRHLLQDRHQHRAQKTCHLFLSWLHDGSLNSWKRSIPPPDSVSPSANISWILILSIKYLKHTKTSTYKQVMVILERKLILLWKWLWTNTEVGPALSDYFLVLVIRLFFYWLLDDIFSCFPELLDFALQPTLEDTSNPLPQEIVLTSNGWSWHSQHCADCQGALFQGSHNRDSYGIPLYNCGRCNLLPGLLCISAANVNVQCESQWRAGNTLVITSLIGWMHHWHLEHISYLTLAAPQGLEVSVELSRMGWKWLSRNKREQTSTVKPTMQEWYYK